MAGLDQEEDIFAPVITSSRRRTVWLAANLATAFLAAWAIGLFEHTIEQVVALAVLMPIVASMGGIAGSQTLTLMTRGMALGHIERGNASVLLWKELGIGALNGLIWALVVALLAVIWFGNWDIGGIIAAAMLLNLVCAAAAGVTIPLVLRKGRCQPGIGGRGHLDHRDRRRGLFRLPRPRHPGAALIAACVNLLMVPWVLGVRR
jgi:magnesium transporter